MPPNLAGSSHKAYILFHREHKTAGWSKRANRLARSFRRSCSSNSVCKASHSIKGKCFDYKALAVIHETGMKSDTTGFPGMASD